MLSHISLLNYYRLIFSLAQHHKWSVIEVENMFPYERDLYTDMLTDHIEEIERRNMQ